MLSNRLLHDTNISSIDAIPGATSAGKSRRKKKNKGRADAQHEYQPAYTSMPGQFHPPPPPPPPPPSSSNPRTAHSANKDRIWNTSTAQERERIKEFWLSLEETERRSLVKVEKEAVLKKMKEQQKHSCSCTVCGRKRTAIEEELEVLYDAYYEELEQYANHQHHDGSPIGPPPGSYPTMPRIPLQQSAHAMNARPSNQSLMAGSFADDDDDDVDDEAYDSEDESEDGYYSPGAAKDPATDFFNFGNSLTVQGTPFHVSCERSWLTFLHKGEF